MGNFSKKKAVKKVVPKRVKLTNKFDEFIKNKTLLAQYKEKYEKYFQKPIAEKPPVPKLDERHNFYINADGIEVYTDIRYSDEENYGLDVVMNDKNWKACLTDKNYPCLVDAVDGLMQRLADHKKYIDEEERKFKEKADKSREAIKKMMNRLAKVMLSDGVTMSKSEQKKREQFEESMEIKEEGLWLSDEEVDLMDGMRHEEELQNLAADDEEEDI